MGEDTFLEKVLWFVWSASLIFGIFIEWLLYKRVSGHVISRRVEGKKVVLQVQQKDNSIVNVRGDVNDSMFKDYSHDGKFVNVHISTIVPKFW